LGTIALISWLWVGDDKGEVLGMLPIFRHPLAVSARVCSMPNLLDRARLTSVALLAAFAALSLSLVGHLAVSGVSVPLPGLPGLGKVLTTPNQTSGSHALRGPHGTTSNAAGLGTGAGTGANAGTTNGAGRGTGHRGSAQSGSPHSNAAGPRQVGVTIGTAASGQPSTTSPAPTSTTPPSPGTSSGSGTASTGNGQDTSGNPSGSQAGSAANNYGHSPPGPTSSSATSNSNSTSSQTSAHTGAVDLGSPDSSTSRTTSSSTSKTSLTSKTSSTISGASGSGIKTPSSGTKSSSGSKVAGIVPGHLK
jgi:hypothetical protein